ncbi:MAG: rRNA (cytidine-2'-O-)-methyltransferase, partial [Ottowia sp.]|nr:rRNA (cytidine-2'-O-)-methyltransferase [Ottowia sp.]
EALAAWLAEDAQRQRGEFVLVLHADARPDAEQHAQEGERTLRLLLDEGLPVAAAARLAARISGGSRSALYAVALRWREESAEDGADVSRET